MNIIKRDRELAFLLGIVVIFVAAGFLVDSFNSAQSSTVTVSATVGSSITCSTNNTTTAFGAITSGAVSTASPNASSTMTCNSASGCTLSVIDAGNASSPGLATTTPAYLIPSTTATLAAGTEGYGIQATTTASGSGGTLGINATYNKINSDVGALSLTTVTLASSTAAVSNREVVVTHKAAISVTTHAASYVDTITYSCTGN